MEQGAPPLTRIAQRVIGAPDRVLQLAEGRAWFELGAFMAASPFLRIAGRGDQHPVLVLPGFTATDTSTAPLRATLRAQGYWVHGWQLGRNLGPTDRIVDGLTARLMQLHERHGRTVSIVGWSLGGIYARELARRHPDAVRQVITMGSPFRMTERDRSSASALIDRMSGSFSSEWTKLAIHESGRGELTVPSTAIYSRTDGVVRWHTCIDEVTDRHENIEVRGSHSGLGFNPAVVVAVSDRLAQREGQWAPFRPPTGLGALYPQPMSFREAV
ncbi:MAG: alpha/beta fold hydrolase [Ilumatobacteraceae bacterium]